METKKRIDTGIRNNPSTGDVLADGGDKINSNFDALYNTFGDQRLFAVAQGIDQQTLHATGYYQKHTPLTYASNVEMGSKHDIDTSLGSISVKLPKVKIGECIEIVNSNGSFSSKNPLRVQTESTDSFIGGTTEMTFRTPNVRLIFWGVKVERGRGVWNLGMEHMFHTKYSPVNLDETIGTVAKEFPIANINDYNVIKFMTYYRDGNTGNSKSSEIQLHINSITRVLYHTEYAVIGNNPQDLTQIEFFLDENEIKVRIQSKIGNNGRFIMKSIDSI